MSWKCCGAEMELYWAPHYDEHGESLDFEYRRGRCASCGRDRWLGYIRQDVWVASDPADYRETGNPGHWRTVVMMGRKPLTKAQQESHRRGAEPRARTPRHERREEIPY